MSAGAGSRSVVVGLDALGGLDGDGQDVADGGGVVSFEDCDEGFVCIGGAFGNVAVVVLAVRDFDDFIGVSAEDVFEDLIQCAIGGVHGLEGFGARAGVQESDQILRRVLGVDQDVVEGLDLLGSDVVAVLRHVGDDALRVFKILPVDSDSHMSINFCILMFGGIYSLKYDSPCVIFES